MLDYLTFKKLTLFLKETLIQLVTKPKATSFRLLIISRNILNKTEGIQHHLTQTSRLKTKKSLISKNLKTSARKIPKKVATQLKECSSQAPT
jgi:hypothetical protein